MRNLKDRLDRLARASATQRRTVRCANCRDWPPVRVQEIDMDGTETWTDLDLPASCPHCGWSPVAVMIEEVDDWRSVGRPQR